MRADARQHDAHALRRFLSADEAARADRFRFDHDRHTFTVARGLLRALLGAYLDTEPGALAFEYNVHGKPYLDGSPVRFNLSHGADWVLYGFSRAGDIGVDVEPVRAFDDMGLTARLVFTTAELALFEALPSALRPRAFFLGWTRKESYLKACGTGLSVAPTALSVTLHPEAPAALLHVEGTPLPASACVLASFDVAAGVVGAVTIAHPTPTFAYYSL